MVRLVWGSVIFSLLFLAGCAQKPAATIPPPAAPAAQPEIRIVQVPVSVPAPPPPVAAPPPQVVVQTVPAPNVVSASSPATETGALAENARIAAVQRTLRRQVEEYNRCLWDAVQLDHWRRKYPQERQKQMEAIRLAHALDGAGMLRRDRVPRQPEEILAQMDWEFEQSAVRLTELYQTCMELRQDLEANPDFRKYYHEKMIEGRKFYAPYGD